MISCHGSPGEAIRIAKVYLLQWHDDGQLSYASLLSSVPHADSVVRGSEQRLKDNYKHKIPFYSLIHPRFRLTLIL